jgi:hypothetical protein
MFSIGKKKADQCPPLPISALAGALCDLLSLSEGLPQPCYITIHDTEALGLQFPQATASAEAITAWAARFGTVATVTYKDTERGPQFWVDADFDWHGISVQLYAHIPVPTEELTIVFIDAFPASDDCDLYAAPDEPEPVDYPHGVRPF